MDLTKLDELLKLEKKTDASKENKKAFSTEIRKLLSEEGYSEKAEYYLFKGFSFYGAIPLATYITTIPDDEKERVLKEIINGKAYLENKGGISFKLLISLFAQVINFFPTNTHYIETIIKELPNKSKNKENKLHGDARKIVDKFFISALSTEAMLPDLAKLAIKPIFLKEFAEMFLLCIEKMNPINEVTLKKVVAIRGWISNSKSQITDKTLQPQELPQMLVNEIALAEVDALAPIAKVPADIKQVKNEVSTTQGKPLGNAELEVFSNDLVAYAARLNATAVYVMSLEKGMHTLEKKNNEFTNEANALKQQLEKKEAMIRSLNEQQDGLKKELQELQSGLFAKQKTIKEQQERLLEQSEDLSKLNAVLSVYTTNNENTKSEQLNAIASKLKVEYIDFLDAEDIEMSLDLGENFRHQIKSIFKVLSKAGIDVGGK